MLDDILDLSKKLISIPSISSSPGNLDKVLDISTTVLSGFGKKSFNSNGVKSLLFYSGKIMPEKFKIILNAHLDVVPGKEEQFKAFEKDGKLYGRGAYDMKAAAAVMMLLFKRMVEKLDYPLGLQIITDEEIGGLNGTKYQIEQGVKADFVIAGENTNLKINNLSKGIIWLKLKTQGKTAHGAYPWLGENAVWKMHKALSQIEKNYPELLKEQWVSSINVANIETNNKSFNKVPDECIAYLDVRYIPEDEKNITEEIKRQLAGIADVEVDMNESSHQVADSNFFINKLKESINQVTREKGETIALHGASDVRFYTALNIPAVTFGPLGAGQHSDNERVDIKSLDNYFQILESFLKNLKV